MIYLNQIKHFYKKGLKELEYGVIKKFTIAINHLFFRLNRQKFLDSDYFLVSYPRSGNTWVRFLFFNSIYNKTGNYNEKYGVKIGDVVKYLIPEYEIQNSGIEIEIDEDLKKAKLKNEFIIYKSHLNFNPGFKKVIYLVRDPRDVFISYFHYFRRIKRIPIDAKKEDIIDLFLNGKLDTFGSWDEHVRFWTEKFRGRIIILKYEELLHDIGTQIEKIYAFLKINVEKKIMNQAIEKSSFECLTSGEDKSSRVNLFFENDKNLKFYRKGIAGQWKNELNEELIFKIENKFHKMMVKFNYLNDISKH